MKLATTRTAAILIPALAACVVLFTASDAHSFQFGNLTVHEWGTFTSVAGKDGAAMDWDALGCQSDLPRFVNDFGYRGFKWRLQGTVRMETPVLYFYSARDVDAQVKVAFPQGLITEWYPKAENQVYQRSGADGSLRLLSSNLNGIDTSLRTMTGAIEWKSIKVQPGATPVLPAENDPSRYYAARGTDAAPLAVDDQHEKFLFYRGVGRFPVPLSARVAGDKIIVENRGQQAVSNVTLFENRQGRIGYHGVGAINNTLTLDSPVLDGSMSQLRHDLEAVLIAQGLFEKEAHAMVETWRDSWFEEGSRLIYIVPQAAVDAILPLQVTPAPSQIVRVFVGRIELVTPVTMQSVESALAQSNWSAVDRYDRFLNPILQRMYPADPRKVSGIEQRVEQARFNGEGNAVGCGVPPTAAQRSASGR